MQALQEQWVALRKQFLERYFSKLNDVQRHAVFKTQGPLLILAGAGSGKTTVIISRIANLVLFGNAYHSGEVANGLCQADVEALQQCLQTGTNSKEELLRKMAVSPVAPWNILAITFTNKAAGELKHRLAKNLGEEAGRAVHASTFHSACVRILRKDSHLLGFEKGFTIYDSDDQQRVLKALYKEMNIDDKFLAVKAAASAIGRLKDKMISAEMALSQAKDTRAQLVAQLYVEYAKRCRKSGAMDFDDLIYHTVRLLQNNEELRMQYQRRYRYILVDEYQDTSVAQFQLVNLLCSQENNICVVGDDDQSIYRFRGATIENILSFERHFPGAEVIRLEQNYRSTGNILRAANGVIENNRGRKGKTLWTQAGDGEKICHYKAQSEQDEAAYIAAQIERHAEQGGKLSDHAVLYRMNAQSSPVENFFTRAGIPHKIVGGLRFNDRKEIKDIHAYMSLVSSPQDDLRLRRIINEPPRKIGASTVDKIGEIASGLGVPMLEVVRNAADYPQLARAQKALLGFYDIYEQLVRAQEELPLGEFATEVLRISGYKDMLKAQGEEAETRLENLGQLQSNVKSYEDMNGEEASLFGYLEEVALISDLDNYDESAEKVVLMTLHSAKGLEFPYVYIVGMEESIFPSDMSRWSDEDLEEERRLCYVGVTRAKKELCLSSANTRLLYGQTRRNRPSRFLEEMDETCLRVEESKVGGTWGDGQKQPRQAATGGYIDKNYNRAGMQASASYKKPMPQRFASAGVQAKNCEIQFVAGDTVKHKVFGTGVVISVKEMSGDQLVEIDFEKVGRKKTMANYAPLEKL